MHRARDAGGKRAAARQPCLLLCCACTPRTFARGLFFRPLCRSQDTCKSRLCWLCGRSERRRRMQGCVMNEGGCVVTHPLSFMIEGGHQKRGQVVTRSGCHGQMVRMRTGPAGCAHESNPEFRTGSRASQCRPKLTQSSLSCWSPLYARNTAVGALLLLAWVGSCSAR
jgi:hypothetical protein